MSVPTVVEVFMTVFAIGMPFTYIPFFEDQSALSITAFVLGLINASYYLYLGMMLQEPGTQGLNGKSVVFLTTAITIINAVMITLTLIIGLDHVAMIMAFVAMLILFAYHSIAIGIFLVKFELVK